MAIARRAPITLSPAALRFAALAAAVVVAYHHSLMTLVKSLTLDTPLAYLGLVPMMSVGLAALLLRRPDSGPAIHDRQTDYIIGLPLLMAAVIANLLLPNQMSTMFWVWRIDVLTLPLFVAGASVLLFGTRRTWTVRVPILFLFLAWPYPYTMALFKWLDAFTTVTIRALSFLTQHIPVAAHDIAGDGSRFNIAAAGKTFSVSVASQCSGANSLLGFVLVGLATMALARGSRHAKVLWMATGATLTWVLNVARIMLIFFTGKTWGEKVAIDAFHPVAGLILFNVGVIVMVLLLPAFRLQLFAPPATRATASSDRTAFVHRTRWRVAAPVVVAMVAVVAFTNAGLARYGIVAGDLGAPRLSSFVEAPPTLAGWSPTTKTNSYDWAKRFFGESSTWNRFFLTPGPRTAGVLWSSSPILADVITGSSLSRLEAYGIEACYRFHGYSLRDQVSVDLGGGVKGTSLRWHDGSNGPTYTTVFWHWPVTEKGKTRYERVTLLLPDTGDTQVSKADVAFDTAGSRVDGAITRGKISPTKVDQHTQELRSFLVTVAREIVKHQPQGGVDQGGSVPASAVASASSAAEGSVAPAAIDEGSVAPTADPAASQDAPG